MFRVTTIFVFAADTIEMAATLIAFADKIR